MPFDPTIAAIRFGMGLSPNIASPSSVDDMLAMLEEPDVAAQLVEIPKYNVAYPSLLDLREAGQAFSRARGTDDEDAATQRRDEVIEAAHFASWGAIGATLGRAAHTPDGFRERLVHFWADHFTVRATHGNHRHLVSAYIEEAIRPNVTQTFGDMLVAAATSAMMILYFDQHQSMGPNSQAASRNDRGLNENLARELLELHTLGVGGSYGQTDVRELAELLTGVTTNAAKGAHFNADRAEPGAETVLGVDYGGDEETMDNVVAVLRDLAVHPDTARHLSQKLAVHFISPTPDASLIDAMTARYLETGGALIPVYDAMLRHDAAWGHDFEKVKQPFDFIASSVRALGVPLDVIVDADVRALRRTVRIPMNVMGQTWQAPIGPDGWSEDAEDWITPQGMAGRITWSMTLPVQLLDNLPDPREFVFAALGPTPPDAVLFAANAAETIGDGVGIVLASAAFQRR